VRRDLALFCLQPTAFGVALWMTWKLPNMRLKLAGADRSKGTGVLCASAHELSFNYSARAGESPAA